MSDTNENTRQDMTVTQLIEELKKLEAAGHGDVVVGFPFPSVDPELEGGMDDYEDDDVFTDFVLLPVQGAEIIDTDEGQMVMLQMPGMLPENELEIDEIASGVWGLGSDENN